MLPYHMYLCFLCSSVAPGYVASNVNKRYLTNKIFKLHGYILYKVESSSGIILDSTEAAVMSDTNPTTELAAPGATPAKRFQSSDVPT